MRAGIRNKREYRESLVSGIFDALFSRIDRWKDNTERERCDTCRLRAVNVSRHTSAISRGRGFYFRRISLALSTSTIFRYTSSIPLIQTFVFRVTFPTLLRRSVSFFFLFLFFFLYLVRFLTIQFIVVRSFLLPRDSRRKKKFEFRENSDFSLITKTRWRGIGRMNYFYYYLFIRVYIF